MHIQVQRRALPQFHLLLNHIAHSHALTIHKQMQLKCTRKCIYLCNFGCTFLCTFIQILKYTFRCNFRCIIRCTLSCTTKRISNTFMVLPFPFSYASQGALQFHSHFYFLIDQILHSFAPLSPFLRALSSAFHIPCHLESQLHLGKLFVTFLACSKQIIDCTLKCTMIYKYVCFIYSSGIVLYAWVK